MKNDMLVIKGKFHFKTSNTYGFFAILLDLVQKSLFEDYIFVSHFSDINQIDIKLMWLILEEQINKILMRGSYANNMTTEFKRIFSDNLGGDYGLASGLIVDYQLRNKEKIRSTLEDFFTTVQKDRNFSIELEFEEINKEKILAAREERKAIEAKHAEAQQKKEQKANVPFDIAPTDQIIPASPVFSPINGISCSLLAKGMKILMRLDNSNKKGQEWIAHFHAFDEEQGILLPLIGTIDQIKKGEKNQYHFLILYGPGQITQLTLDDGVKIKLYDQFSNERVIDPITNSIIPDPSVVNSLSDLFRDKNFTQFLMWSTMLMVLLLAALILII